MNTGKRSRVLVISQGIDGGVAPLVSRLSIGLSERGARVAVRYVGRPAPSKFVPLDRAAGLDSEAIVTGRARSLSEVAGLLRSIGAVMRAARSLQPTHVVFGGFIPMLVYAPWLSLLTPARLVLWDHVPQNTFVRIKSILAPLSLGRVDRIVSISPSTARGMTEHFGIPPERITIVPNGLDPRRWTALKPAPSLDVLRIVMPARLDLNQKDHPTLLRALALLRDRGVDARLSIVGGGVDEGAIRQAVRQLGLDDGVTFLGHSDDIPSVLEAHNVMCLSTRFEGLPTVVIEAMLARRAVVASRVAGCVDLIEHGRNGYLFEAGNASDCADQLMAVRSSTHLQDMIAAAQQEALERYTPQAMVSGFDRVLAELIT